MKNNEYESVEHIDSDLTLMFENAKRYNVPHSSIYKRALKLQHIQQVSACLFLVVVRLCWICLDILFKKELLYGLLKITPFCQFCGVLFCCFFLLKNYCNSGLFLSPFT